jgi:hypothetical protein
MTPEQYLAHYVATIGQRSPMAHGAEAAMDTA